LNAALTFQASIDGTNWVTYFGTQSIAGGSQVATVAAGLTGAWEVNCAGMNQVRIVALSALTGSATVSGRASVATGQTVGADIESIGGAPLALGQTAAATSIPVTLSNENVQDLYITGQSAQTATINNIIPAVAGSAGTDCTGYRSGTIGIVSTGTAGGYIFEQSPDNVNWIPLVVYQGHVTNPASLAVAITPSATTIILTFPILARYIRCRISTTITGGSIQAFTKLAQSTWNPQVMTIAQTNPLLLTTNATISGIIASAAAADATANPTGIGIREFPHLFNGTTWDRNYANWNTTTGDSGTKTTSFTGATQTNFNAKGAVITILCGTVSGTTPTLNTQLQWSPDAGTTWIAMGAVTSNATATGNTITMMVYPSNFSTAGSSPAALTTGATQTTQINSIIPRTWRLNYTIGGTTPSFAITGVYVNYQL